MSRRGTALGSAGTSRSNPALGAPVAGKTHWVNRTGDPADLGANFVFAKIQPSERGQSALGGALRSSVEDEDYGSVDGDQHRVWLTRKRAQLRPSLPDYAVVLDAIMAK